MKWLAIVSFTESSFFPVPPDAMIVPMVLARPERAWRIATVCTIASVIGGFFGYAIGYFLYESIGQPIVDFYGYQEPFQNFQYQFQEWGLWIILIKGLTPIPYKIVTIASGVASFDVLVFALAFWATRGARFFLVAALLQGLRPAAAHLHRALPDAGDDRLRAADRRRLRRAEVHLSASAAGRLSPRARASAERTAPPARARRSSHRPACRAGRRRGAGGR